MQEFIAGLNPEVVESLGTMLIIGIMVISVVGMVQWRKIRQAAMDADLKHQMVERGLSADEIAQVISASPSRPRRSAGRFN
jgi:hypothetical protein